MKEPENQKKRSGKRKEIPSIGAVMQDYQASCALRKKGNVEKLHRFFSPLRVPVGLTDREIEICIAVVHLKKRRESMTGMTSTPKEFHWYRPMTRVRFMRGMKKFLESITRG